jgi:hypothetical protein
LATGHVPENISARLSSSIGRFCTLFDRFQHEIHEEVSFRDIINAFRTDPIKEHFLKIDYNKIRENYIWMVISIIDFPRHNVIEWHLMLLIRHLNLYVKIDLLV